MARGTASAALALHVDAGLNCKKKHAGTKRCKCSKAREKEREREKEKDADTRERQRQRVDFGQLPALPATDTD